MAFRDQWRRPLVLIAIVLVPVYVILWSVAQTKSTPRTIGLPGGQTVAATMRALHGPGMAALMIAFLAALLGVFVMHSALAGDRRLVLAGLSAREAVLARMTVLGAATAAAVLVSTTIMGVVFTPASWPPVIAALALTGLIYAAIGALIGALLDKLAATYLILFLVMSDLGVVQSPMFHPTPVRFAWLLPGYPTDRVLYDGAFAHSFQATGALLLALGWLILLSAAVYLALRRAVAPRA
jgi:hypothetical protein